MPGPLRQVRAASTPTTLTVYQAYPPAIAEAAVAAGRFVAPFKRDRMTWIKPSLLWMAYRSGWATKPDQERVLAVEITRAGFEWALEHSCLSHFETPTYRDRDDWERRRDSTPVRIQWDPERGLHHEPLDHRAIQVGLGGAAATGYVDEWTVRITDITDLVHRIRDDVAAGRLDAARALLPDEPPYPLPDRLAEIVGAST